MFDGYWRGAVEKRVDPIGVRLHRMGISANTLTVAGVISAGAAAVVIGTGRLQLGCVLLASRRGALGFDAKGGLMERAERIIALGIGLASSASARGCRQNGALYVLRT